jgi:hypothetical protein
MNKITFNQTYEFDLSGTVAFGDLPTSLVNDMFKDGRVASKFLENHLPIWFPELEFVDQKGYDHISGDGVMYDLKGFTKGGASYAPSAMIGANRKINVAEMHNHANTINYVFSDITEFPKVRVVFKQGTDLVKQYPEGKIQYTQREALFG